MIVTVLVADSDNEFFIHSHCQSLSFFFSLCHKPEAFLKFKFNIFTANGCSVRHRGRPRRAFHAQWRFILAERLSRKFNPDKMTTATEKAHDLAFHF